MPARLPGLARSRPELTDAVGQALTSAHFGDGSRYLDSARHDEPPHVAPQSGPYRPTNQQLRTIADCIESLVSAARAAGIPLEQEVRGPLPTPEARALRQILGRAASAQVQKTVAIEGQVLRFLVIQHQIRETEILDNLLNTNGSIPLRLHANQAALLVRGPIGRDDENRNWQTTRNLIQSVQRRLPGAVIGVSASLRSPGQISSALRDCQDAVAICLRRETTVGYVDELWADITLERLGKDLTVSLTAGNPFDQLDAYDDRHGTQFSKSVEVWGAAAYNTQLAAERLCLHPNTLRYRLRRVGDLVGLNLADSTHQLVAALLARAATRSSSL